MDKMYTYNTIFHFAQRIEEGAMTEDHVTRSLRPESDLGKAWAKFLAKREVKK